MPSNVRPVAIQIPEAVRLADLYGVRTDLEVAERLCREVILSERVRALDSEVIGAIVSAAVIRYCRCFKSGVRGRIDSSNLSRLPPDDLERHAYFEALRDKFIAHSVNPFEETFVTASATEVDGVLQPISAIHDGGYRVLLSSFEAEPLAALISKVKPIVAGLIVDEEARLLKIIQSMPLEVIHGSDLYSAHQLDVRDVFKARTSQTARRGGSRA